MFEVEHPRCRSRPRLATVQYSPTSKLSTWWSSQREVHLSGPVLTVMLLPTWVLTDQAVVLRQPQRAAQISQGRRNAPSLIRCRPDLARPIPGVVPWGDLSFHPVPHRFLRRLVRTILAPLLSLPTACGVVQRRVPLYHPEARRFLRQRVGTTLVRLPLLPTVYEAIT